MKIPPAPLALFCLCSQVASAATVASPSSEWTPVIYVNPAAADPGNDHQTGVRDGDIVGNATHPAFYTTFNNGGTPSILTDGQIGYRLRVAGDQNPAGFASAFWVGMDLNADGALDVFAGAIEGARVGFYPAGTKENISPSTTSIQSSAPYYEETASAGTNYQFAPITSALDPSATNFNLDGGTNGGGDHTDHFVSFILPFSQLVSIATNLGISNFDETSAVRYVVATANQSNSLNQDLNGVPKDYSTSSTWTQLGSFTPTISANGTAVPEAGMPLLISVLAPGLLMIRRRRGIV